jgi:hypothetical protein
MSTAAILVARIRNRERIMRNIAARNPETYRDNQFYVQHQSAVMAYRDALTQLERTTSAEEVLITA